MEIGLKWVHMARYGVILRLDGALWLRIIFKPLLTQKRRRQIKKCPKRNEGHAKRGPELLVLFVSQWHTQCGAASASIFLSRLLFMNSEARVPEA